jgi:hypothetical protein
MLALRRLIEECCAVHDTPTRRIEIREMIEPSQGHSGALIPDGAIGGTALDLRRPMITFDQDLAAAIRRLSGEARP